jgi:hypothetical protein
MVTEQAESITFFNTVRRIKTIPTNTPIYLTCSYPNQDDVEMLVIPQYYSNGFFHCTVLAVGSRTPPVKYAPEKGQVDEQLIRVEQIIKWKPWRKEDNFLHFGRGYVSEKYISMLLN